MNKYISVAFAATILAPSGAFAASALGGAWKIDAGSTAFSKKPTVISMENGMYDCKTCTPVIRVAADGADHPVAGSQYMDSAAVKVINDHTIQETDKKNGKVVGTYTTAVSLDGKKETLEFTDSSDTNSQPVSGKVIASRVAAGPPGANAVAGSWLTTKYVSMSDNAATFTYKVDGNTLTMTEPTGQSFTAPMDGSVAAYSGDPGVSAVEIRKLGPASVEETDLHDRKVLSVTTSTVEADGKTMKITVHDHLNGRTTIYTAMKQ